MTVPARTAPSLTVLATETWTITWIDSGGDSVLVQIVETRIGHAERAPEHPNIETEMTKGEKDSP